MASRPRLRGHSKYQTQWETEFSWIKPVENKPSLAFCKICSSQFTVESMGRQAVKSHAEGKKHKSRLAESLKTPQVQHFFATPHKTSTAQPPLSSIAHSEPSTSTSQSTVPTNQTPFTQPCAAETSLSQPQTGPCQQGSTAIGSEHLSRTKLSPRGVMDRFLFYDRCTFAEIVRC